MDQMLKGLRVLDMTNNLAAPIAAVSMADYGAEVIHIERPVVGDDSRAYLPMVDGQSLSYCSYNRGKKSVVLDLKDPKGVELVKRMIKDTDVLIESFRPGVMDRLGLGYETAAEINPGLIYCSVSAFGQKGPYREKPGYDLIAQAYSGFMHLTGEKDKRPMLSGVAIGDLVSALNAFGSIMAALVYRGKTGKGQHVDISLCRTMLWCNTYLDYVNVGRDIARAGWVSGMSAPYGSFAGKDGDLIIACSNQNLWEKLCRAMNREDLIEDPRTKTNEGRSEHKDFITSVVAEWLMSFEHVEEAETILNAAGIPNSRVFTNFDLMNDVHARSCEWLLEVPAGGGLGDRTYLTRGTPADFSETPGDPRHPAPALGEHNHEVLEKYGLSPEEVDALEEKWAKR